MKPKSPSNPWGDVNFGERMTDHPQAWVCRVCQGPRSDDLPGPWGNIAMISDSVSLNQTGVHVDTFFWFVLTAGKCFIVEYCGALTMPDRNLHFLKLLLAAFTSFGLEAGRFTNGCFQYFAPPII